MTLWAALIGMTVVTFALRASFLLLPPAVRLPGLLRRALPFVPAAVLTALWAPELLLHKGVLDLSPHNERLLAGAAALLAAWRWRLSFVTIGVGILALHLFDWLL